MTRALAGGETTPTRPKEPFLGPIEHSLGDTAELAVQRSDSRTVVQGERPIAERRGEGIEDNVRHTDSIGRP